MKASEFDKKFAASVEGVIDPLDLSNASRPNQTPCRVNERALDDMRMTALYAESLAARRALEPAPVFARYPDFVGGTHGVEAMAYVWIAREHLRETANFVNEFVMYLVQLRAWQVVLTTLEEPERHQVLIEFLIPLAAFCLSAPYALKARICRSVSELSNQANRFVRPGWRDTVDLTKANFKTAQSLACDWTRWPALEAGLAALNTDEFDEAVDGYRNDFHHGFPRRVELGQSSVVTRNVSPGQVSYSFGVGEPLSLDVLVPLLLEQCDAALASYDAYVDLVREQYVRFDG